MKGTLFSADFVEDSSGNLKLLELNTDTGFVNAAYSHIDLSAFASTLTSNSITRVHVVYKDFQEEFVDFVESYLQTNTPSVTSFDRTLEDVASIYPTVIEDAADLYILRLAYDESAVFDSEYAKNTSNLFKLFVDNNDTGSLAEFYYSSSTWEHNSLDADSIIGSSDLPDVVVKNNLTSINAPLSFYKLGNSSSTNSERISSFISTVATEDLFIQKYYDTSGGTTKVKSIRSYNIISGTSLDLIHIGSYKVDSILEKPTSLSIDDTIINNELDVKHYYEFTTNGLRLAAEGVYQDELITKADGTSVSAADATVNDTFKSYIVSGSPNTDDINIIRAWSYAGSELPSGSYETTSTLVSKTEIPLNYNTVAHIVTSDGSEFRMSPYIYMLTYEIANDQICYRIPLEMSPTTHKLFNQTGSLVDISSVEMQVLEGTNTSYVLDMEEADTFFVAGGNISLKLITHNCFIAGTEIATPEGMKAIETLKPGDEIVSMEPLTKEVITGTIGNVSSKTVSSITRLTFDNTDVIHTTKEHPFYVEGKGWIPAGQLEFGDECKKKDGSSTFVSTVDTLAEETVVYNLLDVTPAHTFYAKDILVHNKCFAEGSQVEMFDGTFKSIEQIKVGDLVKSLKAGEVVAGKVTETIPSTVNDVVPVVEFGSTFGFPQHPVLVNNEWKYLEDIDGLETSYKFVDTFYNLEIDGDVQGSEHNYIVEGLVVSGLGNNAELNKKYQRQSLELLQNVI